jgi:hypothetical protein
VIVGTIEKNILPEINLTVEEEVNQKINNIEIQTARERMKKDNQ